MAEKLVEKARSILSGDRAEYPVLQLLTYYYEKRVGSALRQEFPVELAQPLEERGDGLMEALELALSAETDLDEADEYVFCPLDLAVLNCDAPMARWLVEAGADVTSWPGKEPGEEQENEYCIMLDTVIPLGSWPYSPLLQRAVMNTAAVLASTGRLPSFSGPFLQVDMEKRIISMPCYAPMTIMIPEKE